ncbi:class I SAM-dependent methyltransferase [Falsiroseomonas sp. HW251]|uniref:class I SAM-dependent methyltransferase n=1 Tax=Falsiroseomonas sp. HW251 TaxID=3390998 RepID=UPI003D31C6FE
MTGDRDALLGWIGSYYAGRIAEHGATPRGVDWNGEASHRLRHRQFVRLVGDDPDASVLDLGCGYGDFLPFLRAAGHRGRFVGYDLAAPMIEAARALHGEGADRAWHVGAVPEGAEDYAIGSGILNVKGATPDAEWRAHVEDTIATLSRASRRGFAFNVLSLSSDPDRRRSDLHYADPADMLRMCLDRYGRHVALLQDYGLWEFTVIVRHG